MTDGLAVSRARRVSALFARYGETFTLIRAGVNHPGLGVFAPLDAGATGTYFDGNETVGLLRPALSLYSDGADPNPPALNDLFYRDGRLWTVRKTQVFRLVSTPLLVLALCD
jgi:hypothetical protein